MPHMVYGCWLLVGHHLLWARFPPVEHQVPGPWGGHSAAWVCWSPWPMAAACAPEREGLLGGRPREGGPARRSPRAEGACVLLKVLLWERSQTGGPNP